MTKMQAFSRAVMRKRGTRWQTLMIEGVCAIIFGILSIIWPGLTFLVFLYIFGAYAIIEGLLLVVSALYQRATPRPWENLDTPAQPGAWVILLAGGLLSIVGGLLCIFIPHTSAQGLLYVIAAWALFAGIALLAHARTRGWLLGIIGILAIIGSLLLFFRSVPSVRAILWLVGVLAIIAGLLLIWQGWLEKRVQRAPVEPTYEG